MVPPIVVSDSLENKFSFDLPKYFRNNEEKKILGEIKRNSLKQFDEDMKFIKQNFKLTKDFDSIKDFIKYNQSVIEKLYILPNFFNNEFPNDELCLRVIRNLGRNPLLGVFVHTCEDGFIVSEKIDKIEDVLYEMNNDFFDKLLISVEFI